MESKRRLERRLAGLAGFREPDVALEQYPTPPGLAAHILHRAALHGDLRGTVLDLGSGTGILAIGAAEASPKRVIGLEIDPSAIEIAVSNEAESDPPVSIDWVRGGVERPPLCPSSPLTVVMNPPFGAQRSSRGDREFLRTAVDLAGVSYSIHNSGSRSFVEAFAGDHGGTITHAFAAEIDLDRQFPFHSTEERTIDVEVFRIDWRH